MKLASLGAKETYSKSLYKSCIATLLALSFISGSTAISLCEVTSESIADIETEYPLDDLAKLSIVGFEASISYVEGSAASVKLLGASETPTVFTDDAGVLTFTPSTCSEDSSDDISSASQTALAFGSFLMFLPNHFASTRGALLAATLIGSLAPAVFAQEEGCKPTLDIEITMPTGSQVTEKFGDTDYYLAANVSTVVWGYYEPDPVAALSMESGETVTVEVITHHSGHDYAKMIRGDPAIEEVFSWEAGQALEDKAEPKLPGTGVHIVTGPIEVVGAEIGDVIQVDILELDPRFNPETGKCYGTNSQKFAGYHYRVETKRDGTPYVRTGGTEAITVFEFIEDDDGNMLYGKPVYMYRYPNMTAPDGSNRTYDNNPAVVVPHEFDHGYNGDLIDPNPIQYPEGFNATVVSQRMQTGLIVTDEGGIKYLSPDLAKLDFKVPLRPHLGTLAVLPNNTAKYIDDAAEGGANTIPPGRFGGNVDDWRVGKGGTMFYNVEVPGGMVVVGDTHAAQGDSELAGTAMETSMTAKLRLTLHKAGSLPKKVTTMPFPLLETSTQFVVHGFAFDNYLDELEDPSDIFAEGASLDLAFMDCFLKTRAWMMDTFDLIEEEVIAIMTTAVDFGITQVVDGNWGAHADIPKWVFEEDDTPYDYSCTTSKGPARRHLKKRRTLRTSERRQLMQELGVDHSPEAYAGKLYDKVTKDCETCGDSMDRHMLAHKFLDAKLHFAQSQKKATERIMPLLQEMS
eukprot:scaffold4752_cov113-Cylindrotheca_fusiformis.AAC.2